MRGGQFAPFLGGQLAAEKRVKMPFLGVVSLDRLGLVNLTGFSR
jgi:hypothetical protein